VPVVLRKNSAHVGAEERVRLLADFAVGVEDAEGGVGHGGSGGGVAVARVGEDELTILVVGCAGGGAADADLVIVILTGVLPHAAEDKSVIADDLGEVVGDRIDDTAGVRGIRAAIERGEVCDLNGGNLVGQQLLRCREQVRVIDAVPRAVIEAAGQIVVDGNVIS